LDWRVKSLAFRALSRAPYGSAIHYLAQRYLLGSFPRPRQHLDALWDRARQFIDAFSTYGPGTSLADSRFLELGAGRDLSVPIALRLLGVGRVHAVDISRLAKLELVRHSAVHMAERAGLPPIRIDSWQDVEAFGVMYQAPASLGLFAPATIDCICSNEVLEHVAPDQLRDIADATRRLLRPGGIAVHTIDYSDHYARSDARIDRFNFLTFDDVAWRRHDSAFQYVNRLRHSDYVRIFESSGLRVLSAVVTAGHPTTTLRKGVAERFAGYLDSDLFALGGRLIVGTTADLP
jgi:SAM-dependent methyltransferase